MKSSDNPKPLTMESTEAQPEEVQIEEPILDQPLLPTAPVTEGLIRPNENRLIRPEVQALLDKARSFRPSAPKADASQHDDAMHSLEQTLLDLEEAAAQADDDHINSSTSLRNQADALRRELNHVRYVK